MSLGQGFTLVEVLVALLLVAIALGAGLRASASLTQQAQRHPLQGLAQICADNQLVALRLSPVWLAPGEREALCPQLDQVFSVRTRLSPTPNPSVMRIDVNVSLAEQPLLHLTTVMGRY
ncbi:MAG: prepilin-type N-terminal cleavage/methylation domain-containing protein [Betaproteobacteria bacterium]|nr:prepilin-type N-terminal cleavage/methylation domain-containing protein [Betaproteobacteria bacterium]